jgi:hypothetical protein
MNLDDNSIGGHQYRFGKLSAMQQFHVARRLAPVLTRLSDLDFGALSTTSDDAVGRGLRMMQPIADALHSLSDQDSEYVINTCMSVVQRAQPTPAGDAWAFVWNKSAQRAMFEDIDLTVMLQLTLRVLMESLSGFLPARAPD